MLSTCFVLQVSSPPTGIPKRRLLHAKEQTSCSANIAGVAKHTPSPPPHAADVLLHSTIRPTFEDDVLHSLHFTELEKLKDFESDFSAFLRWFRSSHLGFAASMRWRLGPEGTESHVRQHPDRNVVACEKTSIVMDVNIREFRVR